MLTDVGHLQHVGVETCQGQCLAEGGLMHARRTGSNDDAVELLLLDVAHYQFLPRI